MNPINKDKKWLFSRSIFNDLIISLSLVVLLVTIAINVFNFRMVSKKFEQQFNAKAMEYKSYLQDALESSLWNYDDENIIKIGNSFIKNDLVGRLVIKDYNKAILFKEVNDEPDMVEVLGTITRDKTVIGYIELGLTQSIYQKSNIQLLKLNLIGMVIVLLTLIAGTRYLLKIFLQNPFNKLIERMEHIADGNYHQKPQYYAQKEIRSIITRFDDMASKIENRENSLKEINLKLEASEQNYREIFNATTEAIIIHDEETGAILETNHAFESLWGYTSEEIRHLHIGNFNSKDGGYNQEDALNWIHKTAYQGLQQFEKQVRKKNGGLFWIEVTLNASEIGGKGRVLAVLRDITERKIVQEALGKAHENLEQKVNERTLELQQQINERIKITEELKQFREILEGTSDFVGMFDANGRSILINKAGRRMIELEEKEDITELFMSEYHPKKDFEKIMSVGIPSAVEAGVWSGEINFINRSGRTIPTWQLLISHKNHKGELKNISTIARDIRERKKDEKELQKAKEQAEAANRAKSEFLANMSHEIRTPMNAILGFTQIMKNKVKDPQLTHYLESIHTSGKSLLTLINDILDLSKVEAGKLELQYMPVSFQELFNEINTFFSQKIKDKGLVLKCKIARGLPGSLLLDKARVRQVLINLIGNAVKFTEKGYIKLMIDYSYPEKTEKKTLDLFITVEDTGIGIPEDQHEQIFGAFEQKKGQEFTRFGGTGLGLTITKRLVDLMGGDIKASNRSDHGTIFTITLNQVKVSLMEEISSKIESIIDLNTIEFEKASLLIADDIEFNRELIRGYLDSYTSLICIEVCNGREVLEHVRVDRPDIILLDMKMPEMNGYEVAEILKKDTILRTIPIIAVTASALKSDEETIKKLCDSYLRKPVNQYDMIVELMKYLPHSYDAAAIENTIETRETTGELSDLKGRSVLVADDNIINLEIFREVLQNQGIKVDLAEDGQQALEMVQNKNYDAVLMDIQMPNMDGLTATKKIRALESKIRNIPIISTTANNSDDDRKKGYDVGINDYILKPIDAENLYSVLRKWV